MRQLAGAQSVNGKQAHAMGLLEKLAATGLAFNLAADPDFAALKGDARFRAVLEKMSANWKPLTKSQAAFEIGEKDFLAEGIAYDQQTRTFYVASVYQRKIVKRLPNGDLRPFAQTPVDGLWSIVALAVDAKRRVLWATTAAMEQTRGIAESDIGRIAILQYDLDREKLIARFALPRTQVKRVFGDLLLAGNGEVYISESLEGGLYRVTGRKLEAFIAPGTFASPQGMAWMNGERQLYVADYSLGLLRVDMRSRKTEWLPPPADACLLGLDGMVRAGDQLIATQNGINPQRVVQIALDAKGQVASVVPLEVNHPKYSEPTLGVVVDRHFYYVANAQWELFARGKAPPLDKLEAPLILRLPLAPAGKK